MLFVTSAPDFGASSSGYFGMRCVKTERKCCAVIGGRRFGVIAAIYTNAALPELHWEPPNGERSGCEGKKAKVGFNFDILRLRIPVRSQMAGYL